MNTEHPAPTLDIFNLSRIDAQAEYDGYQWRIDRATPCDAGVSLATYSNGEKLEFWVSETEWCAWLKPFLTAPSLAQVAPELYPALASWTLTPLDNWLQHLGALGLGPVSVMQATPPELCWRLTLCSGTRCLSIYLAQVSAYWLSVVFSGLQPSSEQEHTLTLTPGWCLVPESMIDSIRIGDAIPVVGMTDSSAEFWLHPAASPGRVLLHENGRASISEPVTPISDVPSGTWCFTIEAGQARVSAAELAACCNGMEFSLSVSSYPVLRLTLNGVLYAQGQLLRFNDGWAFRVETKADRAFRPDDFECISL